MLSRLDDVLKKAKKGQAIGHFNVHNTEFIQGIVAGAEKMQVPVILGVTEPPLKYMGIEYAVSAAQTASEVNSIPICLHVDHGRDLDLIFEAIESGFSSVMYDGSLLPIEENIENTLKVVNKAKPAGVSVEAELGKLKGIEDGIESQNNDLTDPEQAQYFVEKTNIDALAVAIGTAHGFYDGEPKIDFERLKAIKKVIDVPLVLHGGSGVPDSSVRKAISIGIKKANVGTALKAASANAIKKVFAENPEEIEVVNYMDAARKAITEKVIEKIKLFNGGLKGGTN